MNNNLIILCCIVMFSIVSPIQITPGISSKHTIFNPMHNKQVPNDRWIWGYVDTNGSDQSQIQSTTTTRTSGNYKYRRINKTTRTPIDPCPPFVPTKRDFNGSGRRISDVKCYEFLWGIKLREDKSTHATKCLKYMLSQSAAYTPIFEIGGRDTTPGEFPHMGAIGWKAAIGTWVFKCGSSLISEKFVLTAAHCTSASTRDTTIADLIPKIVRLGDKNIIDTDFYGQKPHDEKIIRIITNPQYAAPKQYFDIALMELANAVSFTSRIQPACLWNKLELNRLGKEATSTGWGVVKAGGRNISPELQAAVMDIIDSKQCDRLLKTHCNRNWCGIEEHQICAGKLAGGVDACQGDSGGPLQVKISLPITTQGSIHYVIGVTSFGIDCAQPNLPGVYTRVSSFIDWIEDIVWKR